MYGLPPDTDLSFLKGKELCQIAVGPYDVQFKFGNDDGIQVESSYQYRCAATGEVIWAKPCHEVPDESQPWLSYASVAARTFGLMMVPITDVSWRTDGTLTLSFSNGDQLEIYDDDPRFEAYTIHHGRDSIIV